MCLMVWVGSACALAPVASRVGREPDPELGYHNVEPVPADAPIRARLAHPHVTYVGSHEGCGCGFNSDTWTFAGFDDVAAVLPLLDALEADEALAFRAEQRSRETLHAIVAHALASGPVSIFSCWAGDEKDPALETRIVAPDWLVRSLEPFEERILYDLRT